MTDRRCVRWTWLAAVVVLALVGTACSGSDDARSRPTTTEANGPGPEPHDGVVVPDLDWTDCGGGFECTSFAAPLDYSAPKGATIDVAMTRRPASKPGERVGALFMNPGGPGGSAIGLVQGIADRLPDAIKNRFDITGIDPRGVGDSAPIACEQHVAAMYKADPTIEDEGDRRELLRTSQAFVDDCKAEAGPELAHLGTRDVARDMDLARRAMGDSQLSYFGYSYGTAIGQVYAELFPKRVRAMVIDGVVDIGQSGIEAARGQARGFEQALEAFAADCAGTGCDLGTDPIATIDKLTAEAERAPIPAPEADRPAGPAEVVLAMVQALYDQSDWPNLARALSEAGAESPDASRLVGLADSYLNRAKFAPYFAVSCLDAAWPDTVDLLAAAKDAAKAAPHFGEFALNDYVRCTLWPVPAEPLRAPAPPASIEAAPIVVVSTTGDPATPYRSGIEAAKEFPGSALITNVGDRHTAALKGDKCIDRPVFDYLVKLELPPRNLRCK